MAIYRRLSGAAFEPDAVQAMSRGQAIAAERSSVVTCFA
jgi:hypothetical protein